MLPKTKEIAEQVRALLLSLEPEQRTEALHETDLCLHCGGDEREERRLNPWYSSCRCWDDS